MTTFDKQLYQALALQIAPGPNYEVTEYRVDLWATGHLCVTRTYGRPDLDHRISYSDCYRIGPRGGRKTIYSHSNW